MEKVGSALATVLIFFIIVWVIGNSSCYKSTSATVDRIYTAVADPAPANGGPNRGTADKVDDVADDHGVPAGALYGLWVASYGGKDKGELRKAADRLKDAFDDTGDWTKAIDQVCSKRRGCVSSVNENWRKWCAVPNRCDAP